MNLAKDNELTNFCIDESFEQKLENFKFLEKIGLSFLNTSIDKFQTLADFYKDININFSQLNELLLTNKETFNEDIIKINDVNSTLITEFKSYEKSKNKNIKQLINYVYFLNLRIFFYLSISNKFSYSYEDEWPKIFLKNFYFLNKINKLANNSKDIYGENFNIISIFINIPKDTFLDIISKFQNYLTIYLFDISSANENNEEEYTAPVFDREEMEYFMETFNLLWQINQYHKIVHFKYFNNETASKNFDINEDCRIYISNFNKKKAKENKMQIDSGNGHLMEEDNYKFSLINYNFLFDSSRKSDILYAFNYKKMRQESVATISSMMLNPNNMLNLNQINLQFEVRRTHLIEDTMNLVSNPNFNFKKQLKVCIIQF